MGCPGGSVWTVQTWYLPLPLASGAEKTRFDPSGEGTDDVPLEEASVICGLGEGRGKMYIGEGMVVAATNVSGTAFDAVSIEPPTVAVASSCIVLSAVPYAIGDGGSQLIDGVALLIVSVPFVVPWYVVSLIVATTE